MKPATIAALMLGSRAAAICARAIFADTAIIFMAADRAFDA
jgi:hypothetical protein